MGRRRMISPSTLATPAAWHGGDIQGLLDQLDYLDELGVETIWLSPIFETRDRDFMGHGAFHGYWVEDLAAVGPALWHPRRATKPSPKNSTSATMKLMLDLVVNHVGYEAPILLEKPEWFNSYGTIEDWNDPFQLTHHEVHGLPDLNQDEPEVYDYLLKTSLAWIDELELDGFRLDAVKHVGLDFWGRFNRELLAHKAKLSLLGELYDGSPKVVDQVQREGSFTQMFDFPMAFALRDVFCEQKPVGHIAAVLSNDRLYTDPSSLVTFVDNHDLPRITSLCQGDTDAVARALTTQFALRGHPGALLWHRGRLARRPRT